MYRQESHGPPGLHCFWGWEGWWQGHCDFLGRTTLRDLASEKFDQFGRWPKPILPCLVLSLARSKAQKIEQLKVDTMKQQIKVGDQPPTCLNSQRGMVVSRMGEASHKGRIGILKLMPHPSSPWLSVNHDPSCGSKLKTVQHLKPELAISCCTNDERQNPDIVLWRGMWMKGRRHTWHGTKATLQGPAGEATREWTRGASDAWLECAWEFCSLLCNGPRALTKRLFQNVYTHFILQRWVLVLWRPCCTPL